MRILTAVMATLAASPVLAEAYERPIPQPQSATAELWFGLSALVFLAALYFVHRTVSRS